MVSRKTALYIAIPVLVLVLLIAWDRHDYDTYIEEWCEELWNESERADVSTRGEIDAFLASKEYSNYIEYRANCIDYCQNQNC